LVDDVDWSCVTNAKSVADILSGAERFVNVQKIAVELYLQVFPFWN